MMAKKKKKKRRKGLCFFLCCGNVDTVESDDFEHLDDAVSPRGQICLQIEAPYHVANYEEETNTHVSGGEEDDGDGGDDDDHIEADGDIDGVNDVGESCHNDDGTEAVANEDVSGGCDNIHAVANEDVDDTDAVANKDVDDTDAIDHRAGAKDKEPSLVQMPVSNSFPDSSRSDKLDPLPNGAVANDDVGDADTSDNTDDDDDGTDDDDDDIKPSLAHTVKLDNLALPTVPNCPAPPSAPLKQSYTRRASRPRLASDHITASSREEPLKLATDSQVTEESTPPTSNHPAPPPGLPRRSNINRASKPRLPEEHFTFINKNEELQIPSVQEPDDIEPAKRESPSPDLLPVFQAGSDEDTDVESTFSLNSTESELLKLIDFKNLNDTRDEVPTERSCSPATRSDNYPRRNGFEVKSSKKPDILGSNKALDNINLDIPETNRLHPLGAASMVLGPIGSTKGTPEQIPRSQKIMSKLNPAISSLPTARRLEFHQSAPSRGPSTIPQLETHSLTSPKSVLAKHLTNRDSQKAHLNGPGLHHQSDESKHLQSHFSNKMVTFDTRMNTQDIVEPSRRPSWKDPLAASSIERHIDSTPARHSWISNSDMRPPPTSLPDAQSANNQSEVLDSGRHAGASTSSLPPPLPPPDLLAPTLFQRRAGKGLPPVMGRAPPPPPSSHSGIRPGHCCRGGQAAQGNRGGVTGRVRSNKY